MAYWLVKSDPETYGFSEMKRDNITIWDGVRNYQARNNLQLMELGDTLLFYHSNKDMAVVGTVKVVKTAYYDPTTDDLRWFAIDIKFDSEFVNPVNLSTIKSNNILKEIGLVKQSRLSVMPITDEQYQEFIRLSK